MQCDVTELVIYIAPLREIHLQLLILPLSKAVYSFYFLQQVQLVSFASSDEVDPLEFSALTAASFKQKQSVTVIALNNSKPFSLGPEQLCKYNYNFISDKPDQQILTVAWTNDVPWENAQQKWQQQSKQNNKISIYLSMKFI